MPPSCGLRGVDSSIVDSRVPGSTFRVVMRRIRLTYFINDLLTGGAECLLWEVLKRIDREHFQCTVVQMLDGTALPSLEGVRQVNLGLRIQHFFRNPVPAAKAFSFLSHNPCDILHTHLAYADFYGQLAGFLSCVPTRFTTIHNTVEWPRMVPSRLTRFQDRLLRSTTRVIAVSEALREYVIAYRGCPADQVVTIANGLDFSTFVGASAHRARMREQLGIGDDAFVVLCTAQFREEKRHDLVLEAFGHVLMQEPSAHLLLLGNSGARSTWVRDMIRARGWEERVLIRSATRAEVSHYCGAADVFTMHSEHEGQPLALLEAMASGLPVAVPDRPEFLECVQEGVDGRVFAFGDTQAHAEAMLSLRKAERANHRFWSGTAARTIDRFSIDRHVNALTDMYLREFVRRAYAPHQRLHR